MTTKSGKYLFASSDWANIQRGGNSYREVTNSFLMSQSQPIGTASFSSWRTDQPGSGIRSTQQILTDWSDFTNHCFFNSAESKVNVAFDKIINSFPFDGPESELWNFLDGLSGFESYVYSLFPKYTGYHSFHGDHYLKLKDRTGYLFPALSRNAKYQPVIGNRIQERAFQIDFHFAFPGQGTTVSGKRNIFSYAGSDGYTGITIGTNPASSGDTDYKLQIIMSSGSATANVQSLTAEYELERGKFNHVCVQYDRGITDKLYLYVDANLVATSSQTTEFGSFMRDANSKGLNDPNLAIGGWVYPNAYYRDENGTVQTWTAADQLTGSIDDFKIWNVMHASKDIREISESGVYAQEGLQLYYKFNEPTGSFDNSDVLLDSSGHGLHATTQGTVSANLYREKDTGVYSVPLITENKNTQPVLFPSYPDILTINENLLLSASRYDINNPNLITKLIPKHYFLEAQYAEGFETEDGDRGKIYKSTVNMPGGGQIPQAQIITMFLLMWAAYFDELKIYIDAFKTLRIANYDAEDSVPLNFMPFLARYYGFELPNPFTDAMPTQYHDTKNLTFEKGRTSSSLKKVITQLWAQLIIQFPYLIRSKGTIKSIKSLMNAVGINVETSFRMREYGGSRTLTLSDSRIKKESNYKFANFNVMDVGLEAQLTTYPCALTSSLLKAFRHCPGAPDGASGPSASKILMEAGDIKIVQAAERPIETQFTSGSWSYEGHYHLPTSGSNNLYLTQSLFQVQSRTSDSSNNIYKYIQLNACRSESDANLDSSLRLFMSASHTPAGAIATLDTASTNSGAAWTDATYTFTDGATGVSAQHGTGATIQVVIQSGTVNSMTVITPGTGYQINSTWTIQNSQLGGAGGDNLTFDVASLVTYTPVHADLTIPNVNIFDGARWYINVDHKLGKGKSKISLYASRPTVDGLFSVHSASSYYASTSNNVLAAFNADFTPHGTFFSVGDPIQEHSNLSAPGTMTTNNGFVKQLSTETDPSTALLAATASEGYAFGGKVSSVRFWTKSLSDKERREHAINPESVGSDDPITNYNFIAQTRVTGSHRNFNIATSSERYEGSVIDGGWERLRVAHDFYQEANNFDENCAITIDDLAQNGLTSSFRCAFGNATIGGTPPKPSGSQALGSVPVYYSIINPNFDQFITTNKIRVNSYQDQELAERRGVKFGPMYDPDELTAVDDRRFSIEMSSVQRINEDMVNIISDLGYFNSVLGAPELEYAVTYPELDAIREKYFNRLTEKVNYKSLYDFFKWFSINFSPMIDRLMPNTVQFFGVNFVIESHFFERHKYEYKQGDVHVDIYDRRAAELPPLDIIGTIKSEVL